MSEPSSQPSPQPEIPMTPRRERPGGNAQRSPFVVPQRWLADNQLKVICITVAIVSPLLSLWFLARGLDHMKDEVRIWHVDDSGAITWAPTKLADPNSDLFREIAMQATEAYLKRNPDGLSNPEIAARYFSGSVWQAVQRDLTAQANDRKRRNLYDQVEISRAPERLDQNSDLLRYRVVGYVIRSGVIDGLPQRDVGEFRMGIELSPQSRFRDKGRFPFQVGQYRFSIRWNDGRTEEYASLAQVPQGGGRK